MENNKMNYIDKDGKERTMSFPPADIKEQLKKQQTEEWKTATEILKNIEPHLKEIDKDRKDN